MKVIVIILTLFFHQLVFATQDIYYFSDTNDTKRFQALTQQIRCVVCQNQSIAESNAPLAADLKMKVYKMVSEKKSDVFIKNYFKTRYGQFVLFEPPYNTFTIILWAFPFLGLLFILTIFIGNKR